MIFRLSQKLNTKVKAGKLSEMPLDENLYADWSAHLFLADRTQYILLSNTASLYSCVMFGKGITNDRKFIECALKSTEEFMEADGQASVYQKFIIPALATVGFAKALNRSVTGSMNDLIFGAKLLLADGIAPHEIGVRLNETPLSALRYSNPQEVFTSLANQIEEQK